MHHNQKTSRLVSTIVYKITLAEVCEALLSRGIDIPRGCIHTASIEFDEADDTKHLCFTCHQDTQLERKPVAG